MLTYGQINNLNGNVSHGMHVNSQSQTASRFGFKIWVVDLPSTSITRLLDYGIYKTIADLVQHTTKAFALTSNSGQKNKAVTPYGS